MPTIPSPQNLSTVQPRNFAFNNPTLPSIPAIKGIPSIPSFGFMSTIAGNKTVIIQAGINASQYVLYGVELATNLQAMMANGAQGLKDEAMKAARVLAADLAKQLIASKCQGMSATIASKLVP